MGTTPRHPPLLGRPNSRNSEPSLLRSSSLNESTTVSRRGGQVHPSVVDLVWRKRDGERGEFFVHLSLSPPLVQPHPDEPYSSLSQESPRTSTCPKSGPCTSTSPPSSTLLSPSTSFPLDSQTQVLCSCRSSGSPYRTINWGRFLSSTPPSSLASIQSSSGNLSSTDRRTRRVPRQGFAPTLVLCSGRI